MCFAKIEYWIKKYILRKKDMKDRIQSTKLRMILIEEFGPQCKMYLSDEYYLKESKKALIEFLAKDDTDKFIYKKVITDCDDFSFRLMGNSSFGDLEGSAFGILWTKVPNGAHAVNFYVDDDLHVWIIEPQNDAIFNLPEDWEPILVIM